MGYEEMWRRVKRYKGDCGNQQESKRLNGERTEGRCVGRGCRSKTYGGQRARRAKDN